MLFTNAVEQLLTSGDFHIVPGDYITGYDDEVSAIINLNDAEAVAVFIAVWFAPFHIDVCATTRDRYFCIAGHHIEEHSVEFLILWLFLWDMAVNVDAGDVLIYYTDADGRDFAAFQRFDCRLKVHQSRQICRTTLLEVD